MDDAGFSALIARAKTGDEAAVGELLHGFEDDVRMMVRHRLPRALRGQFDSMDFVQAVWTSVFRDWKADEGGDGDGAGGAGSDAGSSHFRDAKHFRGYLAGVARNKVFEEHRRCTQTRKYDLGREESLYVRRGDRDEPREVAAPIATPSEEVQAQDRFDQLLAGRSEQEARVVELRRQGLTFEEIAAQLDLNERSVRRVIETLRQRMEARRWR